MTDDKYERFRHLERARQGGVPDARDQSPGTEGRFGALEERTGAGEGAPPPSRVAEGHLGRFRPAEERALEVAPSAEGELPFVRCAACQMDHNRSAATCSNCGADLRTEEQRAFNARLAAERRAQATVEDAQVAELERAQREAGEEAASAKRAMAETLAREVGDAERRRLDAEGLGGFGPPPGRGGWGGGWGSGTWGDPGWGGGTWGRGRHGALGLGGWLVALLLRFLFGGRRGR
jgi:hypothetical protein